MLAIRHITFHTLQTKENSRRKLKIFGGSWQCWKGILRKQTISEKCNQNHVFNGWFDLSVIINQKIKEVWNIQSHLLQSQQQHRRSLAHQRSLLQKTIYTLEH